MCYLIISPFVGEIPLLDEQAKEVFEENSVKSAKQVGANHYQAI